MNNLTEHWNKIFSNSDDSNLGWFEADFTQTMKFLNLIANWEDAKVFIAGAGTSGLVDEFLKTDAELIINDLSTGIIDRLKREYKVYSDKIKWNCQDLSKALPTDINKVDLWIDRAVLHFIVNDDQVHQYFKNVDAVVKFGGYALFAEFSKSGAKKCAGLDVRRYDLEDFEKNLSSFRLVSSEEYTYKNPKGESRPYIYALFQRVNIRGI